MRSYRYGSGHACRPCAGAQHRGCVSHPRHPRLERVYRSAAQRFQQKRPAAACRPRCLCPRIACPRAHAAPYRAVPPPASARACAGLRRSHPGGGGVFQHPPHARGGASLAHGAVFAALSRADDTQGYALPKIYRKLYYCVRCAAKQRCRDAVQSPRNAAYLLWPREPASWPRLHRP